MLKRLLHIPQEEVTVARRGFRVLHEATQQRLERVGESFLHGYHAALADDELMFLTTRLAEIDLEFRGFAYEGAAMAIDLLDQLKPWTSPRLPAFFGGSGAPHIYMVHVGIGWSMARWSRNLERRLSRLDPLLRWLALDGYGFHEGYFHWRCYANGALCPKRVRGYGPRAFDQGLGRSLWFVGGADADWIAKAVAAFPESRRADLWSGIGLACAYAGGADVEGIQQLRLFAAHYYPHLAQGVLFAAGARAKAGNPTDHTELVCRLLCGLSAQEAAAICDETKLQAQEGSEPAYEVWRRLIRMRIAGHRLRQSEPNYQLALTNSVPQEELENVQRS